MLSMYVDSAVRDDVEPLLACRIVGLVVMPLKAPRAQSWPDWYRPARGIPMGRRGRSTGDFRLGLG